MTIKDSLAPTFANNGSFRTFMKSLDSGGTHLHFHPSYEMNYVLKGEGVRYVGSHSDHFEEGELILLAPGIPHNWVNKKNKSSTYSSLVMQWDGEFIDNMCRFTPEFSQIGKLLSLSSKGVVLNKDSAREIRRCTKDLLNLPPFEKLILLLQILNDFSKSEEYKFLSQEGFQPKKAIPNTRIETVKEFVENNFGEKITLKMVADRVNMSEGAFSRFFSQTYKKPFFTYLNEFRIHKAYKFLEETDLRVNEIGYACGYDCLQFFYRQFMKYTKCAPQDYRKKFLMDIP